MFLAQLFYCQHPWATLLSIVLELETSNFADKVTSVPYINLI